MKASVVVLFLAATCTLAFSNPTPFPVKAPSLLEGTLFSGWHLHLLSQTNTEPQPNISLPNAADAAATSILLTFDRLENLNISGGKFQNQRWMIDLFIPGILKNELEEPDFEIKQLPPDVLPLPTDFHSSLDIQLYVVAGWSCFF